MSHRFHACTLITQSDTVQTAGEAELNRARPLCSDMPSSGADAVVTEEFLHPLYLALVLWHGFVVHAVLQQMFLAMMDLSAVLKLEGAECFQGLEQNLHTHRWEWKESAINTRLCVLT